MHPTAGWAAGVVAAHAFGLIVAGSLAVSPHAESQRTGFLKHANAIVRRRAVDATEAEKKKLASVRKDLAFLARNISNGWQTPQEVAAGTRVGAFVATAHALATAQGIGALATNSVNAVVDALFGNPAKPVTPDGDVRA